MTIKPRQGYILVLILVLSLGAVWLLPEKATVARWWWANTHVAPEVLLFLSQDTTLGVEMGSYYFDSGTIVGEYDIDRAERILIRTLEIDVTAPMAWYQLGRISFLKNDLVTALERVDKQIAITGDTNIDVFYLKGLIQAFAGDIDGGLATFIHYYQYDNENWYINNNIAWLYFQKGDYEAVIYYTERGLQHNPENPWLLMNRAMAYYNLGQAETARELIQAAASAAEGLSEADWSETYPGNDPQISTRGMAEFKSVLEQNLSLVHSVNNTQNEQEL